MRSPGAQQLTLNDILASAPKGSTRTLDSVFYQGPVYVNQPLVIDGNNATIWSEDSPALIISSQDVTVRNLRIVSAIEPGIQAADHPALVVNSNDNVIFDNVELSGHAQGLLKGFGLWDLPFFIDLGNITCDTPFIAILRIIVPVPCSIVSGIAGLQLSKENLFPGLNEIVLQIEKIKPDILLWGCCWLSAGGINRKFFVKAKTTIFSTQNSTQPEKPLLIWQPQDVEKKLALLKKAQEPVVESQTLKDQPQSLNITDSNTHIESSISLPSSEDIKILPVKTDQSAFLLRSNSKESIIGDVFKLQNTESLPEKPIPERILDKNSSSANSEVDNDQGNVDFERKNKEDTILKRPTISSTAFSVTSPASQEKSQKPEAPDEDRQKKKTIPSDFFLKKE